jgi:hypothetical protein
MTHIFRYKVGQAYLTIEGRSVTIIQHSQSLGYQCVLGSDDIWRYDTGLGEPDSLNTGRVTGTKCFPPDRRNFADACWLKHPMYIINLFDGVEHRGSYAETIVYERICKELDRIQTKLVAIQKHYETQGLGPLYDLLFK